MIPDLLKLPFCYLSEYDIGSIDKEVMLKRLLDKSSINVTCEEILDTDVAQFTYAISANGNKHMRWAY